MYDKEILDIYKVMVVDSPSKDYDLSNISNGYITNFNPSKDQEKLLNSYYKPLDMNTLFSVKERENGDILTLLNKQFLHYYEVYGLDMPGLFDFEVYSGKVISLNYVKGITLAELELLIQNNLYTNAPVKNALDIVNIIRHYNLSYDINMVKNNEMKVMLFDVTRDTYSNGDDAVRYICFNATNSPLLIKSKEVIKAVKNSLISINFIEKHSIVLANVFNRHKPIILAMKNKINASIINLIGRLSKKVHIPIHEPITKRFVSEALKGNISDYSLLNNFSNRDLFKYLNLLEYKKSRNTTEAYIIRNGKVHVEHNRPIYNTISIDNVIREILVVLRKRLQISLADKTILLDKNVDYGLPTSRKQTIGVLPFGTVVNLSDTSDEISSGVYWENEWGATDLDLSAIDINGQRVGWGQASGYNNTTILYSGDLTNARNGAMEFLTSSKSHSKTYGLFVNIFSGNDKADCELVIGNKTDKQWIDKPLIREKYTLESKGGILGFVNRGMFTVYAGRLTSNRVSSEKDMSIINRGIVNFWTISRLLDEASIKYTYKRQLGLDYDHDMSYSSITYEKLENLLQ